MSFRQGDSSVAEFVQKFDQGCQFVPLIANDAAEKLRHFLNGLRPTIRRDVKLANPIDYTAAVAKALRGKIHLEGVAMNALSDSGATHSFISESFVIRLKVSPEHLRLGFRVMVPLGDEMLSSSVVHDVELEMQGHIVRNDLIVLLMPEFDIILCMDWLAANGASIDFHQRIVSINPVCGESFLFEVAQSSLVLRIISCLHARNLKIKGCQAFLASIVSIPDTASRTIEESKIVKEFPDFFPTT
ncbi:uncharacterized protein [Primulina huaijiensis]|uniref:uncharacterized protein n=1 Tax=Primulina huaijiensis TaxID=1492673 RepID=UPI003CC757EF